MSLSPITINHVNYSVVLPIDESEKPYAIAAGHELGYPFAQGLDIAETVEAENGEVCPVQEIGIAAFSGCQAERVTIPLTVKVICAGAFAHSQVRVVEGAQGVRIISRDAFYKAGCLVSYPFCKGLRVIEGRAFSCTALGRVTLPDSTARISVDAFDELYMLSMPSTVELDPVNGSVCLDTYKLELRGTGGRYRLEGRFLLTADRTEALWVDVPEAKEEPSWLQLPTCVKRLPAGALRPCTEMLLGLGTKKTPTLQCSRYVIDNDCEVSKIAFYGKGSLKIDQCNSDVVVRFYGPSPRLEVAESSSMSVEFAVDPSPKFYKDLNIKWYYHFMMKYLDGVKTVPMLMPGENVMGKNVKTIEKIWDISESTPSRIYIPKQYPYEFMLCVDLTRCKTIPQLLYPDPQRMKFMALRVPVGMVDAYASHPAWGLAACITDRVNFAKNIEERNKKNKMVYSMAGSTIKIMAKADFGAEANIADGGASFNFDVPVGDSGINLCVSGRTLPCANLDCWDGMSAHVAAVRSFITGEADQLL